MAQNPFDQGCRYLVKMEPVGMLLWLLRLRPEQVHFHGWLDTRRLSFPGEPDRICDTVAFLEDVARGGVPWAVPVEFQIEPDALMFGRLLGYLGSVWVELKPSAERGDRFQVGAVVVNLTGQGSTAREMDWPEAGLSTRLGVVERNLAQEEAGAVLAAVGAGEVSRVVLPFVPLMQGGGEAAIIQEWVRLASAEPDGRRRADYGGLALVFAEAAGCREAWKHALREWNMIQSQQVLEWQAEARVEGEVKGQGEALLTVLEAKFGSVPREVASAIRATTDLNRLKSWLIHAGKAASLDQFRQDAQL
jgi:hypothetical protein